MARRITRTITGRTPAAARHPRMATTRSSTRHDEDHPHEPPAAGSRAAELVTTLFLFIAMLLSWMAFWQVGISHQDSREVLFAWIVSGDLKVDWSIRVDTLTAVMLVVVNTVSAFVHLYSIGYMEEDPHRPALLRVPVALYLRDADAGDGGQPRAAVLRLGGRRPRELSADRLLVSQAGGERGGDQGVRRQPRRRFRLRARHLRASS